MHNISRKNEEKIGLICGRLDLKDRIILLET